MENAGDIGWLGLALSTILVVITMLLSVWRRLGLSREIVVACARAAVQLTLVGLALGLVIDDDDPLILSWIWLLGMVAFAAQSTQNRIGDRLQIRNLAAAAYFISTAVSVAVLFGLDVFPLQGRALVPLAGMMIGNALGAVVLVTKRLVAEVDEHADEIEARLALGLDSREAFAPHARRALQQALIPQIERTKSVGIVFLPGAMVGLVLAGIDAQDAVLVQAAVMFLVLGSVAITSTVMTLGISRALFTPDHRLRESPAEV
ncbi:MAG: iron export ABC transporter permease subunit FetB [Actinomycetota bacterium]